MSKTANTPILAIDGGGTHCRFAIEKDGVRFGHDGGMANVSTDFDGSVTGLKDGLAAVAARAGLSEEEVSSLPAFVGLAGVTGPAIVERLEAALPLRYAQYRDDRPSALRGALGGGDGVIVHCGTGSFFAASISGQVRLAGGWGSVLGDEASAQWLGKRLLAMTLDVVDGFRSGTPLTRAVLDRFGDSAGIVRFAGSADPKALGSLAPLVTDHAAQGDQSANDLMTLGADYIARTVIRMGWTPGLTICLTGGVAPHFAPFLPPEMQSSVQPPAGSPLDGALSLARDHARSLAS